MIWLTGTWRVLVVHLLASRWRSPNNERHAEEADQETRNEARYEPEQARHRIPRFGERGLADSGRANKNALVAALTGLPRINTAW